MLTQLLKSLAAEQKCLMIEILEKSFEGYKQELIKQKMDKERGGIYSELSQKIDKPFIPKIEVPLIRIDKRSLADDTEEEQEINSKKRKIGD